MEIKEILKSKLAEYGQEESICTRKDLDNEWEKYAAFGETKAAKADDLWIRSRLLTLGRIVEEDLVAHTYALIINIGNAFPDEGFAVIMREDNKLSIAAYAKDKFFQKGTSKKAVDQIIQKFNK